MTGLDQQPNIKPEFCAKSKQPGYESPIGELVATISTGAAALGVVGALSGVPLIAVGAAAVGGFTALPLGIEEYIEANAHNKKLPCPK